MSNEQDGDGKPRRDKNGRFVPGVSGNLSGRPPKKRRLQVPGQLARDFLDFGSQIVRVPGPNGPREVSRDEIVTESIYANAVKGKVSSQRLWIEKQEEALADRMKRHPILELAELFRQLYEDPTGDHDPAYLSAVDEWIRRLKRL